MSCKEIIAHELRKYKEDVLSEMSKDEQIRREMIAWKETLYEKGDEERWRKKFFREKKK